MSSRHRLSPSLAGDYLILIGPFDQAFVDQLKDVVPARAREWRPTAKCWRIDPEFEAAVRELIDPNPHRQEIQGSWVEGAGEDGLMGHGVGPRCPCGAPSSLDGDGVAWCDNDCGSVRVEPTMFVADVELPKPDRKRITSRRRR